MAGHGAIFHRSRVPQWLGTQDRRRGGLRARADGSIDISSTYQIWGFEKRRRWSTAKAGPGGFVDLARALGENDWVVGYAYAEFPSANPGQARLRVGSDDGIKIWLNGKLVHHNEIGRPYCPGSDQVDVELNAGTNRLLVKVDNYTRNWGFGVAVVFPGADPRPVR